MKTALLSTITLISSLMMVESAPFQANYDESKVPVYTLPELLVSNDGKKVSTKRNWERKRRKEVLEIFENEMFGKNPSEKLRVDFRLKSSEPVFNGTALRKLVNMEVSSWTGLQIVELLLYVPKTSKKVPVFLGLNFGGNHTVHTDPEIPLPKSWVPEERGETGPKNRATEKGRGKQASRWEVEEVLKRGYGVATMYYGDIEPDHKDGQKTGVRSLLTRTQPEEWSAIGVWSWALSRAVDYLETDSSVDGKKVLLIGHSRLGKTALWAGAQDQRFAIVYSNNSGEGGAAISRRVFGETVERINTSFPHWFNGKFKDYNLKEQTMPMDAHMIIALIAPRPVYITSASEDLWADPKGEFLAGKLAGPVYGLYGKTALSESEPPKANTPIGDAVGYHLREGKHDITPYDWKQYLDFADRHLKK